MFLARSRVRGLALVLFAAATVGLSVTHRDGDASPGTSAVAGQVLDTAGMPVPDAVVYVVGALVATITDDTGWFSLDGIPPGKHVVHVVPPGKYPDLDRADLASGDSARVHLRAGLWPPAPPPMPAPPRSPAPAVPSMAARAAYTPPAATPSRAPWTSGSSGTLAGTVTDTAGAPLPFANVLVVGTSWGAATDPSGGFRIDAVPADSLTVKVLYLGYDSQERRVRLLPHQTLTLEFRLTPSTVATVATLETVQVTGKKEMIHRESSASFHTVQEFSLKSGELHVRGGRSSIEGLQVLPADRGAAPGRGFTRDRRLPNSVGGTTPVNGEPYDAMFFRNYGVNPFLDPLDDPSATFALDVDRASYCIGRTYLRDGRLPPSESVRVEEYLNALQHGYAGPDSPDDVFRTRVEAAPSPFRDHRWILRVGLKARDLDRDRRAPLVLTLVVDVSGSMHEGQRLESVKAALHRLLDQLDSRDRVALVVYDDTARRMLPFTSAQDAARIRAGIDELQPGGSTNAEAGLVMGYDLAEAAFDSLAVNRVVLCSDGVANVGVTDSGGILGRIRDRAREGIELTTVGFGIRNYNDVLLERLADDGDGRYYYVDTPQEVEAVFVRDFMGTAYTVAREAKVQVEFDPETVRSYRQIGYENRWLRPEDFRDDAVDAGEIGAGHEVTALFELKLQPGAEQGELSSAARSGAATPGWPPSSVWPTTRPGTRAIPRTWAKCST